MILQVKLALRITTELLYLYLFKINYGANISTLSQSLFLNNQPDAIIITILFCYKTLHVSGIFSAYHQEFSTVHSALVSFMQVSDDCFQAESGWNSILTLLGSGHQKPA